MLKSGMTIIWNPNWTELKNQKTDTISIYAIYAIVTQANLK